MNVTKKFLICLLVALTFIFTAVAQAEEVDPYFTWEIKNFDDYQKFDSLVREIFNEKKLNIRDEIYRRINRGRYSEAALFCRTFEPVQKVALGPTYFDEGLTELVIKLYMEAYELDKAERKINFLIDNASDNLTKIRALSLKSDLLNRRGNYREALQLTQEVYKLLKSTPDKKLNLINLAQTAKAYCGLDDVKNSLAIVNEINQPMQDEFGSGSVTYLSFASTVIELGRKNKEYDKCKEWLNFKLSCIPDQNLPAVAKFKVESADFYFKINDAEKGEEMLDQALSFTSKCINETSEGFTARKLYKDINSIAVKNLGENHPIALNSEFGLIYINSSFGDIQQTIEFYEKNLPKFKKIFGEENDDTLDMMWSLSDNYLLLGNYSNAKKFAEERLSLCKKHFGDHDSRTIRSTIELANIYYRMGKYRTADELLTNIQAQNVDLFEKNPAPEFVYGLLFTEAEAARMRGDIFKCAECLRRIDKLTENDNSQRYAETAINVNELMLIMEANKMLSMIGVIHYNFDIEMMLLNTFSTLGVQHLGILKIMNVVAESYVKHGKLKEAERYVNQILKLSKTHFGGDNLSTWTALSTLSKVRRAEGKFNDALELDNQALQIAEKVCGKNSLERFQSLDAIASDHMAKGNFTEAIKIRERALKEYEKILEYSDATTIQIMTNLAENYVVAKRYDDAIKLCDDTLALQANPVYTNNHLSFFPSITELVRIKSQAQKLSGDDTNAYTNYKNLIQVYEAKRAANNRMVSYLSGFENKSKWFAEVVPVYKEATSVAASDKVGDTAFAFFCTEFCKGRNLIDRFDDILVTKGYLLTPAEKQQLAKRQEMLDSCRAVSEYAVAINDDDLFIDTEAIYNSAFMTTENFKGDLREKYSENMIPKSSQKNSHVLDQLEQAGFNVQYSHQQEEQNFRLLDLLDLNIWEQSNIWSWDEILKNFDVKKNQKAIPDGACLIEFMKVSDDSLLVTFLRNEGDVQAANIPVDKKFFDDCQLYHELNSYADIGALNHNGKFLWKIKGEYKITTNREKTSPDEDFKNDDTNFNDFRQEISAELSAKLMPTLEKFAGSSSHWIISPDAELNLIPFETLIYHDKLLVESKDVSYVPSLAVMNLMRNRERKNSYLGRNKELFAMGNAIYGNDSPTEPRGSQLRFKFGDLPGTAQELDKVSTFFDSKTIFKREQATEKNLRAMNTNGELSRYKYLLFAAHGIFVPEKPEYSSIVLSQQFNDEDNDGYVTVGEWMGYDLRSNLVYLSACESGRGGYQAGEGIVGIPYALTVAGNKDTVMSLWKVNDAATAEFTSAVFEKLSRGQSEVSALNETKREFLKQENPLYKNSSVWAAFLLYGI